MENDKKEFSEEVQDIIERMPSGWGIHITFATATLVFFVILLSCFIEYPNTIRGDISITGQTPTVRVVAMSTGRLRMLKKDKEQVKAGDVLAVIESTADYNDVLSIEKDLYEFCQKKEIKNFNDQYVLGELGMIYNNFVTAYSQYKNILSTRLYDNTRAILQLQIAASINELESLRKSINDRGLAYMISNELYKSDSLLAIIGALSENNLKTNKRNLINLNIEKNDLEKSIRQKELEFFRLKAEESKIDITEKEELNKSMQDVMAACNVLQSAILQWKSKYLLVAQIEGRLDYLYFWKNNSYVEASQEVFAIIPKCNNFVGEMFVNPTGFGKIKLNQDVNVRLYDFPHKEFGVVKGKVYTSSNTVIKVKTEKGDSYSYMVKVIFPKGMLTNYNVTLPVNCDSKGVAEIITEPSSLLLRLFDNLKTTNIN